VTDRVLTWLAATAAALAAAFTAWSLGGGHPMAAVVPMALLLGVVVAGLALTRLGAFVLLLLAVRPMADLVKLSGPTAGPAGVDGEGGVSRAFDPSTLLAVLFLVAAGLWLAARARSSAAPGFSAPAGGPGAGGGTAGLRTSPLSVALLLVGATCLISALGADRPANSLLEALRVLTVVVMFVVLEQLVPDRRYARRVLLATYLALAAVVAYTVLTSLTGHPPAEVKGSFVRITGPFAQSTTFGRYLMFLLIFGVALYRYLSGRARAALAVLLGLSFVLLLLTNTRSAILGVAIGLVVVAVLQRSGRMLVALALTTVLGLALLPAVGDRFAQLADARAVGGAPTGNTLAWRFGYWTEIMSLANRNPVTGIGPNMTQFQTEEAKKPHNDFLRAYVETGVVGLAAYVAMVVLLLLSGLRALRRAPPGTLQRGVAAGFAGCAVAFVSVSAASNVVSSVATLWYLMAFAAVAGAPAARAAPARQLTPSQPAAANPREATH
jgi:putative inorganic carbon (HCO3(-)) transporter